LTKIEYTIIFIPYFNNQYWKNVPIIKKQTKKVAVLKNQKGGTNGTLERSWYYISHRPALLAQTDADLLWPYSHSVYLGYSGVLIYSENILG